MSVRPGTTRRSKSKSRYQDGHSGPSPSCKLVVIRFCCQFQVDMLDVGTIPRSVTVILENDIVETCQVTFRFSELLCVMPS